MKTSGVKQINDWIIKLSLNTKSFRNGNTSNCCIFLRFSLGDTLWHSVTLCDTRWHSVTLCDTLLYQTTRGQHIWRHNVPTAKLTFRIHQGQICKMLSIPMCMSLTQIFRMGQGRCKYANRKATWNFLFVGNSYVWPICYRLRDNQVWTYECNRFEYMTLKWKSRTLTIRMKIVRRTYLVNLHTCARQSAYVCRSICIRVQVNLHTCAEINASRRFSRLFAVHNRTFRVGRSDKRT